MNINSTNYEECLIKKLEGLLNREEVLELDGFMQKHPELFTEWEALKQTVLIADEAIVFTNKASLKRPERKVVPLYRNLAIVISVAASLLFVVYIGLFKFSDTDAPTSIASSQTLTSAPPISNNAQSLQGTPASSVPSALLIAQATTAKSIQGITHHHIVQSPSVSTVITNGVVTNETQVVPLPSAHVELASLNPHPAETTPYRMKISLTPYKPLSDSKTVVTDSPQPARTTEHASWLQFASVIGTELYRLSGRGELSGSKQQDTVHNDLSLSVETKRFDFLKRFHLHSHKKTNQSK